MIVTAMHSYQSLKPYSLSGELPMPGVGSRLLNIVGQGESGDDYMERHRAIVKSITNRICGQNVDARFKSFSDRNTPALTRGEMKDYLEYLKFRMAHDGGHLAVVNRQDDNGRTMLHYLVDNMASTDSIEDLLSVGADPNIQDRQGNAPLHMATSGVGYGMTGKNPTSRLGAVDHHSEVERVLIKAGANPGLANHAGKTPFACAIVRTINARVSTLNPDSYHVAGAQIDGVMQQAFGWEVDRLRKNLNPGDPVKVGSAKSIQQYLTLGKGAAWLQKPDAAGNTPLHLAAAMGSNGETLMFGTVAALLSAGAHQVKNNAGQFPEDLAKPATSSAAPGLWFALRTHRLAMSPGLDPVLPSPSDPAVVPEASSLPSDFTSKINNRRSSQLDPVASSPDRLQM